MVVIWLVVGVLVGVIISVLAVHKLYIGTLVIDRSDPLEPPYLFTELEHDIRSFQNKKYVLMRVENKNYISQK